MFLSFSKRGACWNQLTGNWIPWIILNNWVFELLCTGNTDWTRVCAVFKDALFMLFSKCFYSSRHWANIDKPPQNHSVQWLWATGRLPTSASPSWQFSIGDACRLVLMWMGLNHMVSLSLSLAVLKNVVLSALAANWSEPIVDSHHHQQVIFPLRVWLLIMYRKSKWKCGYNLMVLGHGEFISTRLL